MQIQEGFYLSFVPSSPEYELSCWMSSFLHGGGGNLVHHPSRLFQHVWGAAARPRPLLKRGIHLIMSWPMEGKQQMRWHQRRVWIETRRVWVFMSCFLLRSKASISRVLYFYLHHKVWGGKVSIHHSALRKVNVFCHWKLQISQISTMLVHAWFNIKKQSANQILWINHEKWQKNGHKNVSEKLLNPRLGWTLVKPSVYLLWMQIFNPVTI